MGVWFPDPQEPLHGFGPTGCGTTSCLKQLAGRLNCPVLEVTGHGRLEFAGLAGRPGVGAGTMVFECGTITPAMRYGRLSASRASTSSLARTAGIVRVR